MRYKYLYSTLIVGVFLFFSGCSFFDGNVELEALIPKNPSFVFTVDFTSDTQVKDFKDIGNMFYGDKLLKLVLDGYDKALLSSDDDIVDYLSSTKLIGPILSNDWKLGVAVVYPDKVDEEPEFYIYGQFAKKDLVVNALNKFAGDVDESFYKGRGIKYWNYSSEDIYIAQYNDIFLLTQSSELRDNAISRLREGNGFNNNSRFLKMKKMASDDYFSYFYADFAGFDKFLSDVGEENFVNFSLFDALDAYGVVFRARRDRLSVYSKGFLNDFDAYSRALPVSFDDYDALLDVVPADGLISYIGGVNLYKALENFNLYANAYNKVDEQSFEFPKIISYISKSLNVDEKVVNELFSSDFAFSVNVAENMSYPSISLFFDVSDDDVEDVKLLARSLDSYFDRVVKSLVASLASTDSSLEKVISRDVVMVNGGALHRIAWNWDVLPDRAIEDIVGTSGVDVDSLKLELYYGLTGDNKFVVSLYPDFDKVYRQNVLEDSDFYKEYLKKFGNSYGDFRTIFRFAPVYKLVDTYLNEFNDEYPSFEDYLTALKHLDYIVSAVNGDDTSVESRVDFVVDTFFEDLP